MTAMEAGDMGWLTASVVLTTLAIVLSGPLRKVRAAQTPRAELVGDLLYQLALACVIGSGVCLVVAIVGSVA